MTTLSDFLSDISYKKDGIINYVGADKEYPSYVVNEIFSRFPDCIYYCNELNKFPNIPNKAHFNYLFYALRKRKRFEKFDTPTKHPDFDLVQKYFNYSKIKTTEALKILTKDDIDKIRKKMYTGGRG